MLFEFVYQLLIHLGQLPAFILGAGLLTFWLAIAALACFWNALARVLWLPRIWHEDGLFWKS